MYTRAFISLLIALVLAIAGLTTSSAQNRGTASSADIPRLQFEKYTLPNGLEVILSQKRGLPWWRSISGITSALPTRRKGAPDSRIFSST